MRPKLSIITVNFNNNSGLSKTLESVRHQSFSSYEHIIIDAGSKDGKRLSKYIFYSSFSLLTFAAKKIISYDAAT